MDGRIKEAGDKRMITLRYAMHGFSEQGVDQQIAPVNGVLGLQLCGCLVQPETRSLPTDLMLRPTLWGIRHEVRWLTAPNRDISRSESGCVRSFRTNCLSRSSVLLHQSEKSKKRLNCVDKYMRMIIIIE
ncbi:hypothetical protein [Permianibacter aggregans]|uniref:hypothetical protein n=1 Tax=Permianibacter aggregans TaxID=1510150 RepID=UPI00106026A1|nr:hypothetical protein [Permianibacter aggregans]QGX39541.1 hypothetical protein E2H98_07675 [Permianibacter aggregans]